MSSGHAAGYADVIEEKSLMKIGKCGSLVKKLKKLCGDEFDNYASMVSRGDSLEEVIIDMESRVGEKTTKKIEETYKELLTEFHDSTGLELSLGFHDPDDGDKYDEVTGVFWIVDGMYTLSKHGKKLQHVVERKLFVQFG